MQISTQTDFWRFLKDAGVISAPTALEIEQSVRDRWLPVGRILLREKHISVQQMTTLLKLQSEETGMRVGDLAVREGFCTQEDVDAALEVQRESCPHPLTILASDDSIDREALLEALYGYVRHLEGRIGTLTALSGESQEVN